MRVIDGDELIKRLNLAISILKIQNKNLDVEDDAESQMELKAYRDIRDSIKEMPTIEERKKGEWIIRENPGTGWYQVTCSECGEDVTSTAPCIGFFPNAKVIWDFCPWCGARMEKSDETQNT